VEVINDKVIGQILYHEIPHLGEFYVSPEYQRKGIGQKLLDRMENIVPEYFTFPSTDASKAFFDKRGLKKLAGLEVYRKCHL
jgi:GNAT superfamily N-acetyltransferase